MKRKEIIMIGSMIGGLSTCSFEEQKAQNQEKISKALSLRKKRLRRGNFKASRRAMHINT